MKNNPKVAISKSNIKVKYLQTFEDLEANLLKI